MRKIKRLALEVGIFWGFMIGARTLAPPKKLNELKLIISGEHYDQ